MVSINKSFLYGICFASLTWLVSLYLYLELGKSHNSTLISGNKSLNNKENVYKHYVNSEKLLKQLQMVSTKNITSMEEDLNELGLIRTTADRKIREDGYKNHAFNVLISSRLSFHRNIPDTRNELCKNISYPSNLPTASIIICFYNEHYHTLLRSIHSITDRTSKELLHEIILVDDFSDIKNLHNGLKIYLKNNNLTHVKLFKTEKREGLIRARIFGSRQAKGDVIIFLDSHIEVNVDWIQPLLSRIKENRTNVVMPVIDIINADTFIYSYSPLVRGGFNWGLHFKWENLPKGTLSTKQDFVKPIKSPTMAGGLFAMDRKYFVELGEYDAFMNIWGGENLEISFRIWMCGGQLEMIPCSRVGHVFRHRRPYGAPDGQDTMMYNSMRVAHVWLDDYKKYYLDIHKNNKNMDFGDISSRIQLRKELKCKDFDWYVKNVYPELTLPEDNEDRLKKKWSALERDKFQPWHSRKRNYISEFQIKLSGTRLCIQSASDVKTKGSQLILRPCTNEKRQTWFETDKHELVLSKLLCLQSGKKYPILYKCHETGGDQEWKHKKENGTPIFNLAAGTCLGAPVAQVNAVVEMKFCTDPVLNMWDFIF